MFMFVYFSFTGRLFQNKGGRKYNGEMKKNMNYAGCGKFDTRALECEYMRRWCCASHAK